MLEEGLLNFSFGNGFFVGVNYEKYYCSQLNFSTISIKELIVKIDKCINMINKYNMK